MVVQRYSIPIKTPVGVVSFSIWLFWGSTCSECCTNIEDLKSDWSFCVPDSCKLEVQLVIDWALVNAAKSLNRSAVGVILSSGNNMSCESVVKSLEVLFTLFDCSLLTILIILPTVLCSSLFNVILSMSNKASILVLSFSVTSSAGCNSSSSSSSSSSLKQNKLIW